MNIIEEIETLKKEKNAVILAHYYVSPEVQSIADYVGDSYYLSKIAVELKQDHIVFCGFRCLCDFCQCGFYCKGFAKSKHFLYSRSQPG